MNTPVTIVSSDDALIIHRPAGITPDRWKEIKTNTREHLDDYVTQLRQNGG